MSRTIPGNPPPRSLQQVVDHIAKSLAGDDHKAAALMKRFMLLELKAWLHAYDLHSDKDSN